MQSYVHCKLVYKMIIKYSFTTMCHQPTSGQHVQHLDFLLKQCDCKMMQQMPAKELYDIHFHLSYPNKSNIFFILCRILWKEPEVTRSCLRKLIKFSPVLNVWTLTFSRIIQKLCYGRYPERFGTVIASKILYVQFLGLTQYRLSKA